MNIKDAINYYGSRSKLARALDVTPQAINNWGEELPMLRQYQIEVLTKGKLIADKGKLRLADLEEKERSSAL